MADFRVRLYPAEFEIGKDQNFSGLSDGHDALLNRLGVAKIADGLLDELLKGEEDGYKFVTVAPVTIKEKDSGIPYNLLIFKRDK